MVTIGISLRYHAENDTYYIQIQGARYAQLDKKIRRLTKHVEHTRGSEQAQERAYLNQCRRQLVEERRRAQCYVRVAPGDVPPNLHARPIHNLYGKVVAVGPERYAQLLRWLCQGGQQE